LKKLMSAREIAALGIPDLPTTKVGVRLFAEREGWVFHLKTGAGGIRRMYEVPERYLPTPDGSRVEQPSAEYVVDRKVVGTIAAGSAQVDPQKLELAIRALGEWEVERGLKVSEERRPAVIAVLYDYLQKAEGEGTEAMALVLRALG
jgi:hypothetical protein